MLCVRELPGEQLRHFPRSESRAGLQGIHSDSSSCSIPLRTVVPFLPAAQYMTRKIPGAEQIIIPDAGHASNIDNVEVFNKAVLDFLRKLVLPG